MVLTANGKTYEAEDISIGTELYIRAENEDEGLRIFSELTDVQAFTLNGVEYVGMAVSKISLIAVKNDSARVIVRMRR